MVSMVAGEPSISFKSGVTVTLASHRIWTAMLEAAWIMHERYGRELVVTSVSDGKHKEGSLHYRGLAFDLRTWHIRQPQTYANELRERLGKGWDVIVEKTHIHVEYDPRPEVSKT